MTITIRLALLGAAIIALSGASSGAFERDVASALWVPAAGVVELSAPRRAHVDGSADVGFTIADVNRAELAAALREHFKAARWRERDDVTVNMCCGIATSFNRGWKHLCQCVVRTNPDGTVMAPRDMAEWHGEWQDAQGNRIGYHLLADGPTVRGYAAYAPKGMSLDQSDFADRHHLTHAGPEFSNTR